MFIIPFLGVCHGAVTWQTLTEREDEAPLMEEAQNEIHPLDVAL